ncbi:MULTISPECIES: helix-turn-helix domain-containing protein [unclassified Bradyrhizobium]|uniref:TetR/AcrR family transcriptional regulator n=1 Tax=unclassified Bradyrhizobium TaxID=2631580 RepID=UPI002915E8A2|nr:MULTISPECIES: helix-turn-helix domain-containing protein [unclassified Bradyrhizobium]
MTSKRDDLLKAAKKLLWERGYEATSPRDIQEASGAGQGSFYHHFDGKLALAVAALEEVSAEMSASATSLAGIHASGADRVSRYLSSTRDGVKGCRLGRFASESAIAEPELRAPIERYFSGLERYLGQALSDAQRSGELDSKCNPADLALMLVAVVQGGYVLSRIHRDRDAINRATAAALALLREASSRPRRAC